MYGNALLMSTENGQTEQQGYSKVQMTTEYTAEKHPRMQKRETLWQDPTSVSQEHKPEAA